VPGYLVTVTSAVTCTHAGLAKPTVPNPRVKVLMQPTVLITSPYVVAGCPFNVGVSPVPCVTGQWLTGTTRVLSNKQPLVVQVGQSTCAPNGTPMVVRGTQVRVKAT
jgi:hypothetical protein